MKATLKFDLSEPDERIAHLRCIKANDMAIVLFEIANNLKRRVERNIKPNDIAEPIVDEVLTLVFEEIVDLIEEQSIDLEELM